MAVTVNTRFLADVLQSDETSAIEVSLIFSDFKIGIYLITSNYILLIMDIIGRQETKPWTY